MSGKGTGKKRNRAAQSAQHGYQEPHANPVTGHREDGAAGPTQTNLSDKQKLIERIRGLNQWRRNRQP